MLIQLSPSIITYIFILVDKIYKSLRTASWQTDLKQLQSEIETIAMSELQRCTERLLNEKHGEG